MNKVKVFIEKCRDDAIIPTYANVGDAGMDVCSAEEVLINPGETKIIKTGLKFAIPKGYEIQVRPRSGISLKTPLRVPNSPGTIDSGYRDELGIIISNTSFKDKFEKENKIYDLNDKNNKNGVYKIKMGDRLAQLVLVEVPKIDFKIVDSVEGIGNDRGGGFGSTGI
ncbi:MAG: dUTP diphosphatase [Clostridiales bacterium]